MVKGRARHIPIRTDTVVRFESEHVVLFLCLCDVGRKPRHKATTRDGVPQKIGRVRHTVLFLCYFSYSLWRDIIIKVHVMSNFVV